MARKMLSAVAFVCSPLIFTVLLTWNIALAHENEVYKHGALPMCYGWEIDDSEIHRCFLDKEHDVCVDAIYSHGIWHVSAPFKCEEKPDGKQKE